MPKSSPPEQVLPAAWTAVLAQVEEALVQAVGAAAEREQTLPAGVEPDAQHALAWQHGMQRLDERLCALPERVRLAEQLAAEVDAVLGAGVEAADAYRAAVQGTARRLAEGVGRSL